MVFVSGAESLRDLDVLVFRKRVVWFLSLVLVYEVLSVSDSC